MKIYIMSCGGYSDITAKAFMSHEEAYSAMKETYEGILESWCLEPDADGCFIDSHHAMICPEGLEEPEGAWGATITEQELKIPETAGKARIFDLVRETEYGTDSLCTICAESYEDAVTHAQIMVLDALKEAFEKDPDEVWGDTVGIYWNPSDFTVACGVDPENIDGFVAAGTYLSLLDTGGSASEADPKPDEDKLMLIELAREIDANFIFEEGMKEVFRLKASGKSMEAIKSAFKY